MFILALSFSFICKSLGGVLMKSSITHIERRFGTTSSEAGLIDGSFELGNLLVITLVSHFGAKSHIPRLIGTGCVIMGIGSFIIALPHFFMGYYKYESALNVNPFENSTVAYVPCSTDLNSIGNNKSSDILESGCKTKSGLPTWIYIMMGNMLRGIGETPIATLGITYIDNFAKEGHSAFYIGILHSLAMVGPIIGFLLGSLCAKLYVDIGYVDLSTITIKPNDTRWVGAWWLGFVILGILSIAAGTPFFFIPKSLKKGIKERKISVSSEAPSTSESRRQRENLKNLKPTKESKELAGFLYSLKRILGNRMYVIYLIVSFLNFSAFIGYITFMSKYLEQQFSQSVSKTNFLLGVTSMPVIAISFLCGGYISKKFKLSILGDAKIFIFTQILNFAIHITLFLFTCERRPVVGLTVTYNGSQPETHPPNISFSFCNSDCNCDANLWDPVCGDDGLTYISPCLAGCKSSVGHGNDLVFHNCSCVAANNLLSRNTSAHLGECPRRDDCSRNLIYFMAVQVLSSFCFGLGGTSSIMLVFKNVEPELKSLAIGFHFLVNRIIGGILAPIYFGAMIDRTCLKWATNKCGGKGSCRIYDSMSYRNTLFGLNLGIKSPVFILYIILFIIMKKHYEENNTGSLNNGEINVDESNLKEPLKNNKEFEPSAHEDSETHI
ncbi:solute carrier organic anion transporter family member 1B1 isoform X2 [Monodelphis domestica]|nr:solute carrier organic anion transporter family member 1B1 isoform X2 [Monodelphis domestica]